MSILKALVEKFISEYDECKDVQLFNQVMQAHPVLFLQKTVETITQNASKEADKKLLRLVQSIIPFVKPSMQDSKLAVIQCTSLLKVVIQEYIQLTQQPAAQNQGQSKSGSQEELKAMLIDIHIKLMAISDEQIINHISDFFESGKVPELVILRIIGNIFQSSPAQRRSTSASSRTRSSRRYSPPSPWSRPSRQGRSTPSSSRRSTPRSSTSRRTPSSSTWSPWPTSPGSSSTRSPRTGSGPATPRQPDLPWSSASSGTCASSSPRTRSRRTSSASTRSTSASSRRRARMPRSARSSSASTSSSTASSPSTSTTSSPWSSPSASPSTSSTRTPSSPPTTPSTRTSSRSRTTSSSCSRPSASSTSTTVSTSSLAGSTQEQGAGGARVVPVAVALPAGAELREGVGAVQEAAGAADAQPAVRAGLRGAVRDHRDHLPILPEAEGAPQQLPAGGDRHELAHVLPLLAGRHPRARDPGVRQGQGRTVRDHARGAQDARTADPHHHLQRHLLPRPALAHGARDRQQPEVLARHRPHLQVPHHPPKEGQGRAARQHRPQADRPLQGARPHRQAAAPGADPALLQGHGPPGGAVLPLPAARLPARVPDQPHLPTTRRDQAGPAQRPAAGRVLRGEGPVRVEAVAEPGGAVGEPGPDRGGLLGPAAGVHQHARAQVAHPEDARDPHLAALQPRDHQVQPGPHLQHLPPRLREPDHQPQRPRVGAHLADAPLRLRVLRLHRRKAHRPRPRQNQDHHEQRGRPQEVLRLHQGQRLLHVLQSQQQRRVPRLRQSHPHHGPRLSQQEGRHQVTPPIPHLFPSKLNEIIERFILASLMPFLEKHQDPLPLALHYGLENISKAIEHLIENSEEYNTHTFLTSFQRYHDPIMAFSMKNVSKHKQLDHQYRILNTINIQMRLTPNAIDYSKLLEQLKIQMDQLYKHPASVLESELVQSSYMNLFTCFLMPLTKVEQDTMVSVPVTTWEAILALLHPIMIDVNKTEYREPLFDILQKSIQRQKIKIDVNDSRSLKHFFKVVLVLLRVIYRKTTARKQAVLILEKIILSMKVYLDIFQKNEDEFNKQIMQQFGEKLQFGEMQILVQELAVKIKDIEIDESIIGFVSLLNAYYSLYQKQVNKELEKFIAILTTICTRASGTSIDVSTKLGELLLIMLKNNMQQTLSILMESKSEFPVNEFNRIVLNQMSQDKELLIDSFTYLTDILNNPEERTFSTEFILKLVISADVGNMMVNASLFIGQLLSEKNQVLEELIPSCLSQIFSTFILRFMTCYDSKVESQSGANASQSCIWAFQNLLNLSNNEILIDSISQHVLKKLLYEDEAIDGIQEITMIYCKSCTLKDIQEVYEFIVPFTQKKYEYYRLGAIIVINQFIKSGTLIKDPKIKSIYPTFVESLLQYDNDDSEKVRAQVALGLGGISYIFKQDQNDIFETELLYKLCESLINSLDDSSEQCIKSSMISLQNVIDYLPIEVVKVFLPPLLIKTTSNFEKSFVQIRVSAFSLFSKICKIFYAEKLINDYIINSLRQALVSIILHLVDESAQVRQVCKLSLEEIGSILEQDIFKRLSNSSQEEVDSILKDLQITDSLALLEGNENMIMALILTIGSDSDNINTYVHCLIEFIKSPEYLIKGAAIFSLLIILAYKQNNLQISEEWISKIQEEIDELMEQKLKPQTSNLILKGTYFLAYSGYKSQQNKPQQSINQDQGEEQEKKQQKKQVEHDQKDYMYI